MRIIITTQLSSRESYGPQTLVCNTTDQKGEIRVVKIYDPLYYERVNDFGNRSAVVVAVDLDYSREVAVYRFLSQQGYDGVLARQYYGSWTFSLDGHQDESRSVRLVLLEYIPAPSLWQEYYYRPVSRHERGDSIPPNQMTDIPARYGNFEQFRLRVYESVLKIMAKHMHIGLVQRDYAPRNVLAVIEDSNSQDMVQGLRRVVAVDYNISVVFSRSNIRPPQQNLPNNPLKVHWNGWLFGSNGWVPKVWEEDHELHRGWLCEKFGSNECRNDYIPLSSEFLETLKLWRQGRGKHCVT